MWYIASAPVSARQPRQSYVARPGAPRSGIQPPSTGQSLHPVMQNGCENTETSDVPTTQKPHTGMMESCIFAGVMCGEEHTSGCREN